MNPNNSKDNQSFRQNYRGTRIGRFYNGWLHLGFTLSVAVSTIVISLFSIENVQAVQYLTIPMTLLYANLVEYFVHKGPMHNPFKGLKIIYQRHATQHHIFFTDKIMQFDSQRDFKAVLFPPILISFFVVFFALPIGLLTSWIFSSNVALLFIATSLAYFATYEILHTLYHVSKNSWIYRFKWMQKMRQLHQNHHRIDLMSRYNFNITFPIGDLLFGTYYSEPKIKPNQAQQTDSL